MTDRLTSSTSADSVREEWSSDTVARISDSRQKEPDFQSCAAASNIGQIRKHYITPVHSPA